MIVTLATNKNSFKKEKAGEPYHLPSKAKQGCGHS